MSTQAIRRVRVRRQWNDHRTATYLLDDLADVHWSVWGGGLGRDTAAPHAFLHGYVLCDAVLDGELAHSCEHGDGPHRVKVCVMAVDNNRKVMAHLAKLAGPEPGRGWRDRRPSAPW